MPPSFPPLMYNSSLQTARSPSSSTSGRLMEQRPQMMVMTLVSWARVTELLSDCIHEVHSHNGPLRASLKSLVVFSADVTDAVIQAARVTVGISHVTHKLQMTPLIQQPPQLDLQGYSVICHSAVWPLTVSAAGALKITRLFLVADVLCSCRWARRCARRCRPAFSSNCSLPCQCLQPSYTGSAR